MAAFLRDVSSTRNISDDTRTVITGGTADNGGYVTRTGTNALDPDMLSGGSYEIYLGDAREAEIQRLKAKVATQELEFNGKLQEIDNKISGLDPDDIYRLRQMQEQAENRKMLLNGANYRVGDYVRHLSSFYCQEISESFLPIGKINTIEIDEAMWSRQYSVDWVDPRLEGQMLYAVVNESSIGYLDQYEAVREVREAQQKLWGKPNHEIQESVALAQEAKEEVEGAKQEVSHVLVRTAQLEDLLKEALGRIGELESQRPTSEEVGL